MKVILLSINICSIYSRASYLRKLMEMLQPQIIDGIEVNMCIDNGNMPLGHKRQRLLDASIGEYTVAIDDDDEISPNYVKSIMNAIETDYPDAVTFLSKRYRDGKPDLDCKYSIHNPSHSGTIDVDGKKMYSRLANHITPIKRSIQLAVGFEPVDIEDIPFVNAIRPLLTCETHIPEYLYTYWYRSKQKRNDTGSVPSRQLTDTAII